MSLLKKSQFIRDLKSGDRVRDLFVVRTKKPILEYANGYRFDLILCDRTGEIPYTYWGTSDREEIERIYEPIQPGDFLRLSGKVVEWRDTLTISGNVRDEFERIEAERCNLGDFLSAPPRDVEEILADLVAVLSEVRGEGPKKIVSAFLSNEPLVDRFKRAPATVKRYSSYPGGLAEHTLRVVQICRDLAGAHPSLDRDLLIVGALLHDIGKTEEFEVTSLIRITEAGYLHGYIVLGYRIAHELLQGLEIPDSLRHRVLHMILSQNGRLEYGSPKTPRFPEALALYYANEMDARLSSMEARAEEGPEEEPGLPREFGWLRPE
jgi:3'-5' exoribonuclease